MVIIDRSKLKATVEIDEIDIQSVMPRGSFLTFDSFEKADVEAVVDYIPCWENYQSRYWSFGC